MKEFIQGLIESGQDRIKTPIISSYLFSFLAFNWRSIIYLLFSNDAMDYKIIYIDQNFNTIGSLVWPMAMGFFYVLIIPYLSNLIDWAVSRAKTDKIHSMRVAKLGTLDYRIDEAVKERRIADAKAGTSEIQKLSEDNVILSKQLSEAESSLSKIRVDSSETEKRLLRKLDDQAKEHASKIEVLEREILIESAANEAMKLFVSDPKESQYVIDNFIRETIEEKDKLRLKDLTKFGKFDLNYDSISINRLILELMIKLKYIVRDESFDKLNFTDSGLKFVSKL